MSNQEDATSNEEEGEITFIFPIVDTTTEVKMKNIPPSTLSKFNGMDN
jgi:hypothetical protein